MAKRIQTYGNKILVEPVQEEEKTKDGFILDTKEKAGETIRGKVLSSHDSLKDKVIYFNQYSGQQVKVNGIIFYILEEEEVLALEVE